MALGLAVLILLPYAWAPVYRFPEPAPFSGSQLWNPYATLSGRWERANLHAHGHAWLGLTSGAQPDSAVAARYREMGYSVAGVSDYQRIAAFHGVDTLPLYEHGFNIGKNHQLAIGARSVDWFDLPLWQSPSEQQYVIDRVKKKSSLIALNHPSSREAYSLEALRWLTGFDLIEVANGPFTTEDEWDATLSSGHAVWAIGNDDTHDLEDVRRTGVAWTMINAASAGQDDVLSALKAGRSYAVLRTGAFEESAVTTLASLDINNSTVTVHLNGAPSKIVFVGQDGVIRNTVHDALSGSYEMRSDDSYIRTVVTSPHTTLFLNPVVRWNGTALPSPVATVNGFWTWTQRGAAVVVAAGLFWMFRRARRAAPATDVSRVAVERA
ncbi:MAG: hypothetical protein U0Q11_01680 [Vicinamibacterales bacterium]